MQSMALLPISRRTKILATLTEQQARTLLHAWRGFAARPDQLLPSGTDWSRVVWLAGRGWGKTRTGAEAVNELVYKRGYRAGSLIGRTAADVRNTMLYGVSGLMRIGDPRYRPKHFPSQRLLVWPNGATAYTYSADEPDQGRGPGADFLWADEVAAWRYPDAWDQHQFTLRMGQHPVALVTTTPRATQLMRDMLKMSHTVTVRGTTYDNRANLARDFFDYVIARYENTRLGRQELLAEMLETMIGALWAQDKIDTTRVKVAPPLDRIVVAIDPSGSTSEQAAEAGIVAVGRTDDHLYVLDDVSEKCSPTEWARKAVALYYKYQADRIVAERNYGGDMVETTIHSVDASVPVTLVTSSRGKMLRAEPVSAYYEQGRAHHVGVFAELEDEMTTYTGDPKQKSPNRLDALVFAATELMGGPHYIIA